MDRFGDLEEMALHEIGHILGLGLGSHWHSSLVNPSETVDTADTHFPGSGAVAAFNAAGGAAYTRGNRAGRAGPGRADADPSRRGGHRGDIRNPEPLSGAGFFLG